MAWPRTGIPNDDEDFVWLYALTSFEVVLGVHGRRKGGVHALVVDEEVLRVGGGGGVFGPSHSGVPPVDAAGLAQAA